MGTKTVSPVNIYSSLSKTTVKISSTVYNDNNIVPKYYIILLYIALNVRK